MGGGAKRTNRVVGVRREEAVGVDRVLDGEQWRMNIPIPKVVKQTNIHIHTQRERERDANV